MELVFDSIDDVIQNFGEHFVVVVAILDHQVKDERPELFDVLCGLGDPLLAQVGQLVEAIVDKEAVVQHPELEPGHVHLVDLNRREPETKFVLRSRLQLRSIWQRRVALGTALT